MLLYWHCSRDADLRMAGVVLSIIIPTYSRAKILEKCLNALLGQTINPSAYEVIVIDDGSTDETRTLVELLAIRAIGSIRYFRQAHRGPAAARNIGVRNAKGSLVLFLGDDIVASPTLLEEHLRWHKKHPENNVAVLGYVTWSPEIEVTPFMRWLEEGGTQFRYREIVGRKEVPWEFFYTSNISLKRDFLLENGLFDEDFPYAAHEDVELAYRLRDRKLRILYNPRAIGYHHHPTTFEDACRRMVQVGESAVILCRKHPELAAKFRAPRMDPQARAKQWLRTLLYPIAKHFGVNNRIVHGFYYYKMMEMYARGYQRAMGRH